MKTLHPIRLSGKEVLPLIEGGKGISVSNGESSGAWAASGGVGTFSGVNADSYDERGLPIPYAYEGRTRRERHRELIERSVKGAITQARRAYDLAGGEGRLHMNILWEMGAAEQVLRRVLDGAKGLIHGVTCGAGMPYRLAEICAQFGVFYYPIVSSARAFRALWKRAYYKFRKLLGAVVYEDPWLAGGHNGLSNSEDYRCPQAPRPRVAELRKMMNAYGLQDTPIIMAGGVWFLRDWEDWIDDPELAPIGFQFGTRPLLTQESPISMSWKRKLLNLCKGDILLHKFSPTGFFSSAVKNRFIAELEARSHRQVPYTRRADEDFDTPYAMGKRSRIVYVRRQDMPSMMSWVEQGYTDALPTPDSTLVFVTPEKAQEIHQDQVDCMGCLSACHFSNWSQGESGTTGRRVDPRSFCIQKTLQTIIHDDKTIDDELMFAGHGAYRFREDPFYKNGFIPSVKQLVERILTGD
ncbi:MAG: nitronate monooxygenase [Alphaproteobacteria bacterium GM202ARS2]|nr:nitronate monooxygenase [Alphaproteobacteria bacterium GM202ARS2]